MEKELIELFETVKRAADAASVDGGADSSPEESRCIDVLKQLKKFPVNYQVLVSTQVTIHFFLCVFNFKFLIYLEGNFNMCA